MTQPNKLRVGILLGGKSAEHEVSLLSAKNIIEAIDRDKYEVFPIGIDKTGQWFLLDPENYLINPTNPKTVSLNAGNGLLAIVPGEGHQLFVQSTQQALSLDAIFPVLHGSNGEDGTIQGLLALLDLPFVGPHVLGSAVAMDKEVTKKLAQVAGIKVARWLTVRDRNRQQFNPQQAITELGLPLIVKPSRSGSSVGISLVKNVDELNTAIELAFQFDRKVLIEEMIPGREIECSVMGNDEPKASQPGEIILNAEFYSYDAKYVDDQAAVLQYPAELPADIVRKVQETSVAAFQAIECEGMARVDFRLRDDGELYLNEINTIPGFTNISMYPKMWDVSGVGYSQLIDQLLQLAIERHRKEKALKTSYTD